MEVVELAEVEAVEELQGDEEASAIEVGAEVVVEAEEDTAGEEDPVGKEGIPTLLDPVDLSEEEADLASSSIKIGVWCFMLTSSFLQWTRILRVSIWSYFPVSFFLIEAD